MASIDPGRFNVFFTLQSLTAVDDGSGGTEQPEWSDVACFWGELLQTGQSKTFRATEMVMPYDFVIDTHYMNQLTQLDERKRLITDSGMDLYINNVENIDHKNYWLRIYCSKER